MNKIKVLVQTKYATWLEEFCSAKPITQKRLEKYFELDRGMDWEHDSIIILHDEIDVTNLDEWENKLAPVFR